MVPLSQTLLIKSTESHGINHTSPSVFCLINNKRLPMLNRLVCTTTRFLCQLPLLVVVFGFCSQSYSPGSSTSGQRNNSCTTSPKVCSPLRRDQSSRTKSRTRSQPSEIHTRNSSKTLPKTTCREATLTTSLERLRATEHLLVSSTAALLCILICSLHHS